MKRARRVILKEIDRIDRITVTELILRHKNLRLHLTTVITIFKSADYFLHELII